MKNITLMILIAIFFSGCISVSHSRIQEQTSRYSSPMLISGTSTEEYEDNTFNLKVYKLDSTYGYTMVYIKKENERKGFSASKESQDSTISISGCPNSTCPHQCNPEQDTCDISGEISEGKTFHFSVKPSPQGPEYKLLLAGKFSLYDQ